MSFLDLSIYGNSLLMWFYALLASIGTLTFLRVIQTRGVRKIKELSTRTATLWDDAFAEMFEHTKLLFLLIFALFLGSLFITLPDKVRSASHTLLILALLIQTGIWLNSIIKFWVDGYKERMVKKDPASVTTMTALSFGGRLVVWSVILLLILDNLGVNVTALVAGLGVGGIAVALAVQNILGDLFASLSIVLDKPFTIGDFLMINDYLGSVEYIGLKTTRLRSLSGEQLIFSNTDMLGSRIRNYGRMYERRVVFNIGVIYQTSRDLLQKIPTIIKHAVEAQKNTRFDRSHFKEYGEFALKFETVYYVLGPDYNTYMDIQEAINLRIHEEFEKEQIEFAYPSQTLFLHNMKPSNELVTATENAN
ncbi:MAG: mechanosensitive ion channel family protein [Gammaproteobacteria bacterium]